MLNDGKDDREVTVLNNMEAVSDGPTVSEVAEMWMNEIYRNGDWTAINRLHDGNFVDHSPGGRESGNKGYSKGVRELYKAFPDFHAITEDMIIENPCSTGSGKGCNGKVVIRWSATGTQHGEFLGFGASRKTITFRGIEILMIIDGRITDRWGEWDGLDLLDQLGERSDIDEMR